MCSFFYSTLFFASQFFLFASKNLTEGFGGSQIFCQPPHFNRNLMYWRIKFYDYGSILFFFLQSFRFERKSHEFLSTESRCELDEVADNDSEQPRPCNSFSDHTNRWCWVERLCCLVIILEMSYRHSECQFLHTFSLAKKKIVGERESGRAIAIVIEANLIPFRIINRSNSHQNYFRPSFKWLKMVGFSICDNKK